MFEPLQVEMFSYSDTDLQVYKYEPWKAARTKDLGREKTLLVY